MSRLPRVFFTADNLFGCEATAETRGFPSVERMNGEMIERWNDVVGPDDLVWVLGDFHGIASPPQRALTQSLNGAKNLVAGPLDRTFPPTSLDDKRLRARIAAYRDIGFRSVVTGAAMMRRTGRPLVLPLRARADNPPLPVIVSHFPYDLTPTEEGHQDRFPAWRPKRPRTGPAPWLVHGHNADWVVNERQINVGTDAWGFEPVGAETVLALIADTEQAEAG
jgi:calcineurin-like phosphoesterase family protein